MSPYSHVLCPVDFSDVSGAALEWSLRFTRDIGARLTVLHVVDTGFLAVGNLVAVPETMDTLRDQAERALETWKHDVDLGAADVRLVEGRPADAIVAAANDSDVDLLVMGSHGLTGFQKLVLGSVTEKVLHRVRVPMLAVSARELQGETGREALFRKPRRIVMALDFGPESQSVIRHGVWLAEHWGAGLVAAHAVPVPYVVLNDRTIERLTPKQLEELEEGLVQERRKELEGLLPESTGVSVELSVRVGAPFDVLQELARDGGADLVVMGAGAHGETGLGWLGSTCHKMVRSGASPVLIVR